MVDAAARGGVALVTRLLLALLAGCVADPPGGGKGGAETGTAAGDEAGEDDPDPPAVDADGDGAVAADDCDDADPGVYPGAPEVCDGVDQDCDGIVDDGVPSDGAGCADPGWPTWGEAVDTVQIVLATADAAYAGSDDPLRFCLGAWCKALGIPDWDDRERAQVDVHTFEGVGLSRADLTDVSMSTTDGPDRWQPAGIAVSLDGEGVYSRRFTDLYVGTEGGAEVASWSDGLGIADDTVWGAPLTHGPILGAPTPGGARVWFRTDRTRRVALRVAETAEGLADAAPVAVRYPGVDRDFTEDIALTGLGVGRTWAFDLTVDDQTFGPWTLRAGPDLRASGQTRIAFGSCSKDDAQPIFAHIRALEPDLFLFVGDNHYGNTADVGALRQWYRWAHARDERRELMAEAVVLATWDDHDYVGNNTDGSAPGKDAALRVFAEYWANGRVGLDGVPGVFSAHRWGDVGIWLLDDRYWRGLDGTLLGETQENWLIDSVAASDAVFKLVVSGSQWTLDGSSDSWAAFPEAQGRVVDALSEAGGVVLLSGDIHRSELITVPASAYDLPELTSSPLANAGRERVIVLDIDTSVSDPTLVARILDGDGAEVERLELTRSALE